MTISSGVSQSPRGDESIEIVQYHVFAMCGKFKVLREEARGLILRKVEKGIDEFNVESHVV
jgi:hypothetical protein